MKSLFSRYSFLLPAFVLLFLVMAYPVLRCLGLSFFDRSGLTLDHYLRAGSDPRFLASLWNTCVFTGASLAAELLIGLGLALCLNIYFRGRGLTRAIVLVPWALPPAVIAMGWRWIFNDTYGVMSDLLIRAGLTSTRVAWLGEPGLAMFSLVAADVWKTAPFVALILLAGLQSIPPALYEAAAIDGAGPIKRFFLITWPLLLPYLFLAAMFRGIQAFGVFDLVWVLTRGGPGGSTETVSLYIHDLTFRYMDPGYASAVTVIVFLILFASAIITAVLNRRQYELA